MHTSFSRHSVNFYCISAKKNLSGDDKQVQVHVCTEPSTHSHNAQISTTLHKHVNVHVHVHVEDEFLLTIQHLKGVMASLRRRSSRRPLPSEKCLGTSSLLVSLMTQNNSRPLAIFRAFQPDGRSNHFLVGHSVTARLARLYSYQHGLSTLTTDC
jgi:hypothetical protein